MQLRQVTVLALSLTIPLVAIARGDEGASAAVSAGSPAPDQRHDFGSAPFFYSAVDSTAVKPYETGSSYFHTVSTGIFCNPGSTDTRFLGQIVIPHGVRMSALRVWLFDSNAIESATATIQSACLPDFAAAIPIVTDLGTVSTTGAFAGGAFSSVAFPPANSLSDNQSCTYQALVQLSNAAGTCGSNNVGFYKARIEWERFIPVAPAVASFTDVPPGAQFFREIEALAASGITAGCTATPGGYCPEDPVTRRQMGAFFARGLGLPQMTIVDPANP